MEDYSDWEIVEEPGLGDWEIYDQPQSYTTEQVKQRAAQNAPASTFLHEISNSLKPYLESGAPAGLHYAATRGGLGISQALAEALGNEQWQENIHRMGGENEAMFSRAMNATSYSPYLVKPGEFVGEAIKTAPEFLTGEAAVTRLAPKLAPKLWPYLQNVLGMTVGGAMAEPMNYTPEDSSKLEQAVKGGIGGGASAAILYPIMKVLSGDVEIPDWLTRERAGNKVGTAAKDLKKELVSGYENYKKDFREAGIRGDTKTLKTKTVESNIVDPNTGKPVKQTIKTFEAPTFEEVAHDLPGVDINVQESVHNAYKTGDIGDLIAAESDLGVFENNQWQDYWQANKPLDRNAIHFANKKEAEINKIIEDMAAKLSPTKAKELLDLRARWRTELRPFLDIDPINRYVNGKITGADLTRRLQANTKEAELFRATIAKRFKDVSYNKLKNDLVDLGVQAGKIPLILKLLGK